MVALLSDAVGFVTLLLIDIGVIRELAIGASLGVAVIILTNLILLPVAISYMGISQKAIKQAREEASRDHPFWRALSNFASPTVAPISITIAVVALAGGLWYGQNLKIGDLDRARRSCTRIRATTGTTISSSATTRPVPTCWW